MSEKILVTGGAGFIGTNAAHALVADGYDVVVVDDLSAGDKTRLPEAVTFHQADINDTDVLTTHMKGVDRVLHLAACPRVQDSIERPVPIHTVNVDGTLSVLEAAKSAGVKRVVLASTSAIYGDNESLPLKEEYPTHPMSPYALHKLVGEEYCKLWSELYGLETVSLRLFNVYGPYFDPNGPYALVIGKFLDTAAAGGSLQIFGDGEQTRDFVHVTDVVRAFMAAMNADTVGKGEVMNIGSGAQTTINELAHMFSDDIQYNEPRIEPRHTCADVSLAHELLGWEPSIKLADGIKALKEG